MNSNVKLLEALNKGSLDKLEEMLRENIREESLKGLGSKKQLTIVKSLVTGNVNPHIDPESYIPFGDKFAFTNGHEVVFADEDFGYSASSKSFDFSRLVPTEIENEFTLSETDLKHAVSLDKASKVCVPIIIHNAENDKYHAYSPKYIADAAQFCEGKDVTFKTTPESDLPSPLFAYDKNSVLRGLILPASITPERLEELLDNPYVIKVELGREPELTME